MDLKEKKGRMKERMRERDAVASDAVKRRRQGVRVRAGAGEGQMKWMRDR